MSIGLFLLIWAGLLALAGLLWGTHRGLTKFFLGRGATSKYDASSKAASLMFGVGALGIAAFVAVLLIEANWVIE